VNNGYIDHVHVPDVVAWEKGMHSFMSTAHKDLLTSLNKDWSDDIEAKLKDALASYAEVNK
jgi:F0F1-type ATP synthase alpha subunit